MSKTHRAEKSEFQSREGHRDCWNGSASRGTPGAMVLGHTSDWLAHIHN